MGEEKNSIMAEIYVVETIEESDAFSFPTLTDNFLLCPVHIWIAPWGGVDTASVVHLDLGI